MKDVGKKIGWHIVFIVVLVGIGIGTGLYLGSIGANELIGQLRDNVAELTNSNLIAQREVAAATDANLSLRGKLDDSLADLKRADEVNRGLIESNNRLESRVSDLEATNSELKRNNQELTTALGRGKEALGRIKTIVGELESGTGSAEDLIGQIIGAFRQIREAIEQYYQ